MAEASNGNVAGVDAPPDAPTSPGKQGKKPRAKRKPKATPEPSSNGQQATPALPPGSFLLSDVKIEKVDFLFEPFIPKGMLTIVVGRPSIGKSTFLAWLTARARFTVMIASPEESMAKATAPRLEVNGVKNDKVLVLKDPRYKLPRGERLIVDVMRQFGAELLIMDPVSSSMEEGKVEISTEDVRGLLESAHRIAEATNAAVVGVRHPGKKEGNVLKGSTSWEEVPRSVVVLEKEVSNPPRHFLRHHKDGNGTNSKARLYSLAGEPGTPKLFELGAELDVADEQLAALSDDLLMQWDVREVCKVVKHLFQQDPEPLVNDLVVHCRNLGISETARRKALNYLGIERRATSVGGKRKMVRTQKNWPPWLEKAEL